MSKKEKQKAAPVAPLNKPLDEAGKANLEEVWQKINMHADLPRPLPIEFTPREIHYLSTLIASDSQREVYRGDATAIRVIETTFGKILRTAREYFNDLERVTNAKTLTFSIEGELPAKDKP